MKKRVRLFIRSEDGQMVERTDLDLDDKVEILTHGKAPGEEYCIECSGEIVWAAYFTIVVEPEGA